MNNKLTKEQLLTALMIKLDQIEYKIETLQSEFKVFMESHETIQGPPKPFFKMPPQWPNESYEDYLKRIGEYNTAQSDDEYFGEVYK